MTKISRLIFLLSLTISSALGQQVNLILSREQNNAWLDSVKTLPLVKQLSAIKQRLLSDTNIFVRQNYLDRIRIVDQIGNRVYGDSKPFIIIGGYPMIIDNKTEAKTIIRLTQILDTINIKTLFVFSPNDPAMSAIYGNSAQNGIIVMTLTRKKYLKKFRQLKLKPNC